MNDMERSDVSRSDVSRSDVSRSDVSRSDVSCGPAYLSPSSIACYEESNSEFFLRYMVRVPRMPQTQAMAAGSAFDACVKAWIMLDVDASASDHVSICMSQVAACNISLEARHVKYGTPFTPVVLDTSLSFHMQLYECFLVESVEVHNLAWARDVGKGIFIDYRSCGALENLLHDACDVRVIDELTWTGDEARGTGLVLLGKPDLVYTVDGVVVVDDWKVNGYCSQHSVSPTPGYVDMFPSRAMHKNCVLANGVNTQPMPLVYTLQLVVYSLLVHGRSGGVVGISQLVFDRNGELRVAKHRYRVSGSDIDQMLVRAQVVWDTVCEWSPGASFGDVSAERCTQLMKTGSVLSDDVVAMLSGRGL